MKLNIFDYVKIWWWKYIMRHQEAGTPVKVIPDGQINWVLYSKNGVTTLVKPWKVLPGTCVYLEQVF